MECHRGRRGLAVFGRIRIGSWVGSKINKNNIDFEEEKDIFQKTFDLLYEVMDENAFKKYDKEKNKTVDVFLFHGNLRENGVINIFMNTKKKI